LESSIARTSSRWEVSAQLTGARSITLDRPARQQAEEIADVAERLETVHLAAGQEGDESCVHLAAIVVSDKEPIPPAEGLSPQSIFGPVVVDGQRPSSRKRRSASR
jgi:hypothetical protein